MREEIKELKSGVLKITKSLKENNTNEAVSELESVTKGIISLEENLEKREENLKDVLGSIALKEDISKISDSISAVSDFLKDGNKEILERIEKVENFAESKQVGEKIEKKEEDIFNGVLY